MGCGVLSRDAILWWSRVLGWWERLSHGFGGSWGLLVTLQIGRKEKGIPTNKKKGLFLCDCFTCRNHGLACQMNLMYYYIDRSIN